ncbi:MAG: tetratricopeptide repeat protein [Planctomycetes bacterium]|nr:tetratricopeptide repeat protein [Planctomycetota bacterium]
MKTFCLMVAALAIAGCGNDGPTFAVSSDHIAEGASEPHGQLDSQTLYQIALRHMREGQADASLNHLHLAIEQSPDEARLYDARATANLSLGNLTNALADAEKAVALDDGSAGLLVNRANIYVRFGRANNALQDYAAALAIENGYAPALINRGILLFNQGDNEAALSDFSLALQGQAASANLWFNRAMVYEALGQLDAARNDMFRFIDLASTADQQDLGHEIMKGWNK